MMVKLQHLKELHSREANKPQALLVGARGDSYPLVAWAGHLSSQELAKAVSEAERQNFVGAIVGCYHAEPFAWAVPTGTYFCN